METMEMKHLLSKAAQSAVVALLGALLLAPGVRAQQASPPDSVQRLAHLAPQPTATAAPYATVFPWTGFQKGVRGTLKLTAVVQPKLPLVTTGPSGGNRRDSKGDPDRTAGVGVLVGAQLWTRTRSEDKDPDTAIYVEVGSSDGATALAWIGPADSSGNDSTRYADWSTHTVNLWIAGPVPQTLCRKFHVRLEQVPSDEGVFNLGHDTWQFDAKVILFFSDGSNFVARLDKASLSNDATVEFDAP